MTDEQRLPRVWVGNVTEHIDFWSAEYCDGRFVWYLEEYERLHPGDIFVPGNQPKPTIDPTEVETIRTCGKVDWA